MTANSILSHDGRNQPEVRPVEAATDRLRHLAMSFLPLALFVTAVLGFERIAAAIARATPPASVAALSKPAMKATISSSQTAPPARQAESHVAQTISFDDRRDLRAISAAYYPNETTGQAIPTSERTLKLETADHIVVPLKLAADNVSPNGSYGTLRGIPASARLSHGIAVSAGTWLIDGADLQRVTFEMRGAQPSTLPLDLTVLSSQNRLIARERVSLELIAPPIAPPEPVEVVPPPLPSFAVSIKGEQPLVAGRGQLLAITVNPANRIPDGSYIVLRGLPTDTMLSKGLPVGPGVWLLTASETKSLEVKVPARTAGEVRIQARLATSAGQLLAETAQDFRVISPPSAAPPEPKPKSTPVAEPRTVAPPAPPPPSIELRVPRPIPATRPVVVTPALAAPIDPPRPEPKSKAASAEDRVVGNPILSRGRRMLLIGNVAIARPLLERAASNGSGEAAALLGASFDPDWLKKAGVLGIVGEPARARRWYDEARRLGSGDIERIVAIPQPARPPVNLR